MKPILPARQADASEPSYPSLNEELQRHGITRRGFLAAALAAGGGAMAGCMGAPPRPRYMERRWHEVRIAFARPLCLTGCDARAQSQSFDAVDISSQNADLVARLRPAGSQAAFLDRVSKVLQAAVCRHTTLAAFRRRVEDVLKKEVQAWYRVAAGVTVRPHALNVRLKPGRRAEL